MNCSHRELNNLSVSMPLTRARSNEPHMLSAKSSKLLIVFMSSTNSIAKSSRLALNSFVGSGRGGVSAYAIKKFAVVFQSYLNFFHSIFSFRLDSFVLSTRQLYSYCHLINKTEDVYSSYGFMARSYHGFSRRFAALKLKTEILNFLVLKNINFVFVVSNSYHKRFLPKLSKLGVISIGMSLNSAYSSYLSISIPVANDTIFSQILFIRLLNFMKSKSLAGAYLSNANLFSLLQN
jgi:hypothetical protein